MMNWRIINNLENTEPPLFSARDLFVASFGFVFSLIFLAYPAYLNNMSATALSSLQEESVMNPFASLEIEGGAAYVLDLSTGQSLYEKNSEAALPLASLTKIMTAVTALSTVPESTVIKIDLEDLALEGDSGLYADENWRLADILGLLLIESSNDGAYAVATSIGEVLAGIDDKEIARRNFVSSMNQKAKEIGLSQSYFLNPTGLDESTVAPGAYGSARDMAMLLGYAVNRYPDIFRNTRYSSLEMESLSELLHTAKNTNKELDGIPVIIASKTGFTDLAGGNLVVVFNAGLNRLIAVSVLGSSLEGRFKDVQKLAWAAVDFLSKESTLNK